MSRNIVALLSSVVFSIGFSCSEDENGTGKVSWLSSNWLGEIETTDLDYDSNNSLIDQNTYLTSEGKYKLMLLNDDKTALIKYSCDKTKCDGSEYNGKWDFSDNVLRVYINREELNSLADALLIEGKVVQINNSSLIIEKNFYNLTSEVFKRVRQIRYLNIEQ